MEKLTLKEFAIPMIKAIDTFNYLLKSHHRRVAIISYYIGKKLDLSNDELLELVIAASLHDIGALSITERDMLLKEDVETPIPHCIMGYRMLASFDAFHYIAQTIRHHHVNYQESLENKNETIPLNSFIIHLADRVDILIEPNQFILCQKESIINHLREKSGTLFHPQVFDALEKASKMDIFWIDINNMTIDQLFQKLNFSLDFDLTFETILEFAQTMSRIIDFRSRFTASHSYTVAQLAAFIGEKLDWNEVECKKLKIAGYLHDIGKIGIDPSLIEKTSKLSGEENQIIKLHPYYTEQILHELHGSDWFEDIVNWASNHHENINGTGYPHAYEKQEIAEGTKIMAFSDVITALLENRPYREGMNIDVAFQIIKDEIAPKISPEMFKVIEQSKEEILVIVQECKRISSIEYQKGLVDF